MIEQTSVYLLPALIPVLYSSLKIHSDFLCPYTLLKGNFPFAFFFQGSGISSRDLCLSFPFSLGFGTIHTLLPSILQTSIFLSYNKNIDWGLEKKWLWPWNKNIFCITYCRISFFKVTPKVAHIHATARVIQPGTHPLVQAGSGCWNTEFRGQIREEDCCWLCEDSLKWLRSSKKEKVEWWILGAGGRKNKGDCCSTENRYLSILCKMNRFYKSVQHCASR